MKVCNCKCNLCKERKSAEEVIEDWIEYNHGYDPKGWNINKLIMDLRNHGYAV